MVELTDEQFEAAKRHGDGRLQGPRAVAVRYDAGRRRVVITLSSGIELGLAPSDVEGLAGAASEDLRAVEIVSQGLGVHFSRLDADFDVSALLKGVLGSRQWMAPRQNAASDHVQPIAEPSTVTASAPRVGEGTIQLSEESLVVGKRMVNRGSTRVRRYVVETPVEEQVSLHDERVVVDRRPVADGRTADATAFADNDKVIEMTETTEQAVVGKTARVVEEVSLRKQAADRTETIHDTVRKEEVEVTQVPGETVTDPTLTGQSSRKI